MGDLVQFLRDRLDEDEAAARRAGDSFRQIGETGVIVATEGDRAEECASANWAGIAEHIVRHDPARVFAEVAAKRLLLDRWCELQSRINAEDDQEKRGNLALTRHGLDMFVCQLGTVYADHPDYRQEWRP